MSAGSGGSSSRGPLPTFGGPPSKAYYECKICKKVIRRDRIRDHYATYIDIDTLKKPMGNRLFAISRLSADKRKHTEGVADYFDKNRQLPADYDNLDFRTKTTDEQTERSPRYSFFAPKRKTSLLLSPLIIGEGIMILKIKCHGANK